MNCRDFEEQLDDYMNGDLPPASRAAFEEHAADCRPCMRKRDEAVTLRNRLRAEFAPPIPDGPDSFHQFKREIAMRQSRTRPRRRFALMRAFSLAAVLCLIVGYGLVSVPVSYSLPSGMRIALNFDPPLTEAPEFEGLILPQEFYDAISTDEALINNFTTVQGPDGLTGVELEISSSDPEVAAKVYQTLITNYPALEGGKVEYRATEELKHEPVRVMILDKHGKDDILTDEEINKIIISKGPEIEYWVQNEIMPLVKGIEIDIQNLTGDLDLDDIEKRLKIKILDIQPDEQCDTGGIIKRKFIIQSDIDDISGIKKLDILGLGALGVSLDNELIRDDELADLLTGVLSKDEFTDIIRGRLDAIPGKIKVEGADDDPYTGEAFQKALQQFITGVITDDEFEDTFVDLMKEGSTGLDIMILKLDDGELSFENMPFEMDIKADLDVKLGELKDLKLELSEIKEYIDAVGEDSLDIYINKTLDDVDPETLDKYLQMWRLCIPGEDELSALLEDGNTEAIEKWIRDHAGEIDFDADSFMMGESDSQGIKVMQKYMLDDVSVSITSDDEDFDLGAKGDDVITEEVITDDDRAKLKSGKISIEDFESTVTERLDNLGLIDNNFEVLISDDEASYKIVVEDGVVIFDFSLFD